MLDQNGQPITAATGDQNVAPELVNGRPLTLYPDNTFGIDVEGQAGDFSFSAYMIDANGVVGATATHTVTAQIGADVTPDAFNLGSRTGVALNATNVESDVITVEDIDPGEEVDVTVTGGQYRVSTDGGTTWGAWTSAQTTVQAGYQVQARGNAAGTHGSVTNVVLAIGGVTGTFSITTLAAPTTTPSISVSVTQSAVDQTVTITATPLNFSGQVTVEFLRRQVAFSASAQVIGSDSSPPYSFVNDVSNISGGSVYEYTARVGGVVSSPVQITVDKRPAIYLFGPTAAQKAPFTVSVVPSEALTGLTASDFTVVNGTATSLVQNPGVVGSTLHITPAAEFVGNVQISLLENVCTDSNGNGNLASFVLSVPVNTMPADETRPVITLLPPTGIQQGPATFLVQMSEQVTGLTSEDFVLANCTFVSLQQPSVAGGLLYSLPVMPPRNQQGSMSVAVRADAVQDAAGNTSLAVAPVAVSFDTSVFTLGDPPSIGYAIPDKAPWAVGSPFTYTVPNNAFAPGDGGAVVLTARLLGNQPLPAGMEFDGTAFNWPVPVIGRYQIEVVATDLLGLTESQVFVLDVVGQQTQSVVRLVNRNGVALPGRVVEWAIRSAWTGPALAQGTSTSDGQGRIQLSQLPEPGGVLVLRQGGGGRWCDGDG